MNDRIIFIEDIGHLKIGDIVYIVENYNDSLDSFQPILTSYNKKIKITEFIIEGFLIDEDGDHIAECGWDGWTILDVYHNLYISENDKDDAKIFKQYSDAVDYAMSL